MRAINLIVVHCSDSDQQTHDDISVIREWHLKRGFDDVGYHYFIKKNGEIQKGRNEEVKGAHVKNHNANSIGICLSGRHNFDKSQFESLNTLISGLIKKYKLETIDIVGHHELDKNKTCPNFNVHEVIHKKTE